MQTIRLKRPDDWHIHLRDDSYLGRTVGDAARYFGRVLVMPNLVPPIDSLRALEDYRHRITMAQGDHVFHPYMTVFFRDYTEAELAEFKDEILGIKLYPAGATTNSEAGVKDVRLPVSPLVGELNRRTDSIRDIRHLLTYALSRLDI